MDAATLAAAVAQANDGIKTAMGVASLVIPKIDGVAFQGVSSGDVIYASGRAARRPSA